MIEKPRDPVHESIVAGVIASGAAAVERARTTVTSLVIWRNNRIQIVSPDEVNPPKKQNGKQIKKNQTYVERRAQGDYAVRKLDAVRASAIEPTQAKAIERAREISPKATPLVERVRRTNIGRPDHWRKP
jgi:hypothetical protein